MNKIYNLFEIAGETAMSKDDRRSFVLGAVAIRNDGAMVKALNGPTEAPNRSTHAEYRVSRKMDQGAVVYVARIRLCNYEFGMSRPCPSCMKVLKSKKVRKIYYTINNQQFGIFDPINDTDRVLEF